MGEAKFKRGDRVEWVVKDVTKYGVVDRVLQRGLTLVVIHDGGEYQTKAPFHAFKLSDKPKPACAFKKGVRVQWTDCTTQELRHGTVTRVCLDGMTVDVMLDGGTHSTRLPVGMCALSTKALPVDVATPMDAYGVSGYREIKGHGDSPTFHCAITLRGKVIGEASNDGWGGSNCYRFGNGYAGGPGASAFLSDVKAWWQILGGDDKTFEIEDLWLDWYVNQKPYAVTAAEYVKGFCKDLESVGR